MPSKDKKDEIILRTAEMLSSENGREITTRKIAENAGINPAMVNYYFGSKKGLLKATVSAMNGNCSKGVSSDTDGSRKAMFDHLIRICETTMLYSSLGLDKDAVSFSKDSMDAASRLMAMKRSNGNKDEEEDLTSALGIVCFLMAASTDPEGFLEYSGTDVRVKSQLRMLVSKQLDILLGDAL